MSCSGFHEYAWARLVARLPLAMALLVAVGVSAVFASQACAVPDITSDLEAYYQFEGNTNDSSGNDNHGTAYGGPGYTSGVFGSSAISMDGVSAEPRAQLRESIEVSPSSVV